MILYPLQWPTDWNRTRYPQHNRRYKMSAARVRSHLLKQFEQYGVENVRITTNQKVGSRGSVLLSEKEPLDTGVAAYWDDGGETRVLCCDSWLRVQDNLHSIGMAIEALRLLERCGAGQVLERAYRGFAALPAVGGAPNWRLELGIKEGAPATRETINQAYRARALDAQRQGPGAQLRLNQAKEAAFKEITT